MRGGRLGIAAARRRAGGRRIAAGKLLWVPPLLAGVAVATAMATSAGILLYNSGGLSRAVALLVVVAVVSGVAGIWMGATARDGAVRSATRGWMGLLGALLAGAVFAGAWEFMGGFGAEPLAQGLGLALTLALPAYFAGGVWGRTARFAAAARGTPAALQIVAGGAGGVLAGGGVMLRLWGESVLAVTLFLGAAVLASAGARFQGWIFDRMPAGDLPDAGTPDPATPATATPDPATAATATADPAAEPSSAPTPPPSPTPPPDEPPVDSTPRSEPSTPVPPRRRPG